MTNVICPCIKNAYDSFQKFDPARHTWIPHHLISFRDNLYVCERHCAIHLCKPTFINKCPCITTWDGAELCIVSKRVLCQEVVLESETEYAYTTNIENKRHKENEQIKSTDNKTIITSDLRDDNDKEKETTGDLYTLLCRPIISELDFVKIEECMQHGLKSFDLLLKYIPNNKRIEFYTCLCNVFKRGLRTNVTVAGFFEAFDAAILTLMRLQNDTYEHRSTIGRRKIDNLKKYLITHIKKILPSKRSTPNKCLFVDKQSSSTQFSTPNINETVPALTPRRRKIWKIFSTPVQHYR